MSQLKQDGLPTRSNNDDEKGASQVLEHARDPLNQQSVTQTLAIQGVTKGMIFFSLFISLAGWIFNFDLGE